jgi:hypothetical protein
MGTDAIEPQARVSRAALLQLAGGRLAFAAVDPGE